MILELELAVTVKIDTDKTRFYDRMARPLSREALKNLDIPILLEKGDIQIDLVEVIPAGGPEEAVILRAECCGFPKYSPAPHITH